MTNENPKNNAEDTQMEQPPITLIGGVLKKGRKKKAKSSKFKTDTASFIVDQEIQKLVPDGEEFLTTGLYTVLKDKHGLNSSDVSGQLYAKKQQGLLTNRDIVEEEAEHYGYGLKVWQATPAFYDKMGKIAQQQEAKNESDYDVNEQK